MIRYAEEYRINKKGCECFRTRSLDEAKAKLEELKAKKPNVAYTMQSRTCRKDRYGNYDTDWYGRLAWSPWS